MFSDRLEDDGWIVSNDFADCWIKHSLKHDMSITIFPSDESDEDGCVLVEATHPATGDYFSASAGTISSGYPSLNVCDSQSLASDFIRQVYSRLNSRTARGATVPFSEETAETIIDTLRFFDESTELEAWG